MSKRITQINSTTYNKRTFWTKELCLKEAKKYETRCDFQNGSRGAYLFAQRNKLLDDVCLHMQVKKKYWTKESCLKEAKKYKTRYEFRVKEGGAYEFARLRGFLDEICSHMKEYKRIFWTKKLCLQEAKKYKTKLEFMNKNYSAYRFAKKNGLLDSSHFQGNILWTKESCLKEAKKYKTRNEFRIYGAGAYYFARNNNFLDKICNHMPEFANQTRRESKLQKQVFNKLKRQYKYLKVQKEVKIPKRDNKNGRVDLLIKNHKNGNFICIEVKHSMSKWTRKDIKIQLNKYKRSFRERKGFKGVVLISDDGTYGQSIDQLEKILKKHSIII